MREKLEEKIKKLEAERFTAEARKRALLREMEQLDQIIANSEGAIQCCRDLLGETEHPQENGR